MTFFPVLPANGLGFLFFARKMTVKQRKYPSQGIVYTA